jgi:hypothetical protein
MGQAQYIDGIVGVLKRAGVSEEELEEKQTEIKLSHAFMKGIDFEVAGRAMLRLHGIDIEH